MPGPVSFRATVVLGGKTATGIQVPEDIVESFNAGKRPAVTATINRGHSYRTTIAPMGGASWIPLSAENRTAAGVAAGDEVEVALELDTAPREVAVPDDFAADLDAEPAARSAYDALSYSRKRWYVEPIGLAKSAETRQRRIEKAIAMLKEGRG